MKPDTLRVFAPLSALIGLLLAIKLFDIVVAPDHLYPGRTAAFPAIELGLAACAALAGGLVSGRSAVVRVLPRPGRDARRVWPWAVMLGAVLGCGLAALDSRLRIGNVNVGLPLAPLFYLWGGIVQALLTHFLPVALVVGLLAQLGAGQAPQRYGFAVAAVAMAGLAALGMATAFQMPDVGLVARVAAAPFWIAAAVFVIELALFEMFRRHGFMAALAMRLGFYAVWHIAWPALAY